MHSKPMLSGPGALVDDEEFMAFRISSGLIGGHWRCCLFVCGRGSSSAVGGGGKSDCLKSCALLGNVVAVRPSSLMSGVGSVRRGFVYLRAVKMSFPRAFLRNSFQRLVLASLIVRWYRFLIVANWFQLGVVRSAFHCLSLDFMRVLLLLMSSFHHGLERGDGFDFGIWVSAASCMRAVRYFAALLRFVWLLWRCRDCHMSEVESLRSLRCLPKLSQLAFFQFHRSLVGASRMVFSLELISYRISSWSEEVGLSSSTAQFEMRGVIVGEENARSRTDEPCA